MIPIRQMLRACRQGKNRLKFADTTGVELTGAKTMLYTLVFRQVFRRLLGADEQNVGILMPTSVYGAIVNLALAADRRTSVNLNYTFGLDTINYCINHAEIKHVVTSRKVLDRFPNLKLDAEILVMEELGKKIKPAEKITAWIDTHLTPLWLLDWKLGLNTISPDDMITLIFTSGSTGTPKGAMLSHQAIADNIDAFTERLAIRKDNRENDFALGSLPFFHAYGFTTTLWLPATSLVPCVYHFNPLEPKKIGEIAAKYRCTLFPTTPTFLRNYLRRCPKEDFATTQTIICGAEKLPKDLINAWEEKYGHRPAEGFGATELSPVVSTNVPKMRRTDYQFWLREGSIGRPFYNVQARITNPDNGEVLGVNEPGMLEIKGTLVMKGYYKDPHKTASVLRDGWYITGDIARIDQDGFIWITGRQSRMSKIGGEMVPHILIEEAIEKVLQSKQPNIAAEEENGIVVAVSAVPDQKKGERIIVLHCPMSITPEEVCKQLHQEGMPNLWVPSPNDFYVVDKIPVLGTGKLDLRAAKHLAESMANI